MAEPRPDLRIFETAHCTVDQASGYRLPGYLIVEIKGEAERLLQLAPEQAADLFAAMTEAERIVQELVAPERIYVAKYAELNPRVHLHVIPRTAELGAAYLAAVDDPHPINGARLTDWLWFHQEELGHTDAELAGFVEAARALRAPQ